MKVSIFPRFGALNSGPVFKAFGLGAISLGHEVVEHDLTADVFVIWSVLWNGRMSANEEIWDLAKKQGKKLIILEVGGLLRGKTWRVGLGHINNLGFFYHKENYDLDRPRKLGIELKNLYNFGENVLICGQHSKSQQWNKNLKPETWLENVIQEVKKHTDRKIIFRPHPRDFEWCKSLPRIGAEIRIPQKIAGTYDDFDHVEDFARAHIVLNLLGNTAIQAALSNIPVYTSKDSLAYPISIKNLENLENPESVDKNEWLLKICHCEWTLEEISQGNPLDNLL